MTEAEAKQEAYAAHRRAVTAAPQAPVLETPGQEFWPIARKQVSFKE